MEARSESTITGRVDDDARALAARLVNAIYRLVKACQIHAENNQAVAQVVEFVGQTVEAYAAKANVTSAAILFTANAVFVNRQMLRASRETYQLALELGQMLEPCGVTEVTLHAGVAQSEISEFGRAIADFVREGKPNPHFSDGGWEHVKLRKVQGLTFSSNLTPPVKAARTYAAALMIVRGFYEDLKRGTYELKQGIKRVAQKLVSQNETGGRLLLSIAAAPAAEADRAGVALSTTIVALAMASQLTEDRTLLSNLASASLLYDAGRQRLVGHGEMGAQRVLNAQEEELLPVSSVVALTALGKFHPPSVTRSVIVHEALALKDGVQLYGGKRQPSLMSRILAVARAFVELRVTRGTTPGLAMDDALQILESQARDSTERALVKLLMGALGIFPAGTMVELSTGEMGIVLSTPALPVDFARPPVRVMYDANAQLLENPIDIDLAKPAPAGEPQRYIKRPIDTTDQQMKQMRAYVVEVAARRARRQSADKMRAVIAKNAPSSSTGGPSDISSHNPHINSSAQGGVSYPSAPSGAISNASSAVGDRSAPTIKPPTRRWDGGADEAAPLGTPEAAPQRQQGIAAPSPGGPVAPSTSTRALKWQDYGKELAQAAGNPAAAELSDTDALLAAYLAEESAPRSPSDGRVERTSNVSSQGGHPSSQGGHSSQGAPSSSQGGPDSSSAEARSFGLRWGDRPSAQGVDRTSSAGEPPSRPGDPAATALRGVPAGSPPVRTLSGSSFTATGKAPTGSGFGAPGRSITGDRPAAAFGTPGRSITGDRPSAGFGSPGRSITGDRPSSTGLRWGGREPDSSQGPLSSDQVLSPPPHGGTKLGVGSTAGIRWGGGGLQSSRPGAPDSQISPAPDAGEESFSFEERPFDAPAPSASASRPQTARQPLRGSLARPQTAPAPEPQPAVSPPAPEPPAPPPAAAQDPQPGAARRGKAGSLNWGAPRRNDKK